MQLTLDEAMRDADKLAKKEFMWILVISVGVAAACFAWQVREVRRDAAQ